MAQQAKRARFLLGGAAKGGLVWVVMSLSLLAASLSAFAGTATFSGHTPGKNAAVNSSDAKVSVYVKSSAHHLLGGSVRAKLNGAAVAAAFEYPGRWVEDYDSGDTYYVIDSYREGTITVHAGLLADGASTVEVSIGDVAGNVLTDSWTFTVAEPPKIREVSPAHNSAHVNVGRIAAVVTDNGVVDWGTVNLRLNGTKVIHSVDAATGGVFSDAVLPSGLHRVELTVRDGTGNLGTRTWSFVADAQPPAVTALQHFFNGMTVTDGKLCFGAALQDLVNIKSNAELRLNGQVLGSTFGYRGFYDYDGNWVVSDRKEAFVNYEGPVAHGSHVLTLYAEDSLGNRNTYTWAFTAAAPVNNPPYATSRSPAQGAAVPESSHTITLSVKDDEDILNTQSLRAKLNGQNVLSTFRYRGRWVTDYDGYTNYIIDSYKEGTVTVEATGLNDGVNNIEIAIADATGNTLAEAWSYSVSEPPKISGIYPAANSETASVDRVSAVVTDNGAINWGSVILQVNGSPVTFAADQATGTVTHARNFADGRYSVNLAVRDAAGLLRSQAWSFIVDTSPPALEYLHDFQDNMVITDALLKVRIMVKDLVDIKNNAKLYLNGVPLPAQLQYPGSIDTYSGEYIVTRRSEGYLDYEGAIGNGNYTLSLYVEDKLGNRKTWDWRFTVASPPVIFGETPLKYGVENMTPTVAAFVRGQGAAVNAESIRLLLNGAAVPHEYDSTTGKVWYTPAETLANEFYHSVALTVRDETGLETARTWQFYTNTFPDMYDASITSCSACHDYYPTAGSSWPFQDIHAMELNFGGDHLSNDCDNCHNYITVNAGCGQCHGQTYDESHFPHGARADQRYGAKNSNPYFPLRISRNREMFDCVVCHQPGAGTLRRSGAPLKHHDIPELHKTGDNSCSPCHALSLTREHARDERQDKSGNPINCDTCHRSADANVTKAVQEGKTGCYECHDLGSTGDAHAAIHDLVLDPACEQCHGSNMATEKKFHATAVSGCGVCHDSTDTKVSGAIHRQKNSCFDCHGQPHGVYMTALRDDLPLYDAVKWGTPQEALLWSGDGWLPESFKDEQARIIFSSRGAAAADVYQYYSGAMASHGWTLQADTYAEGARAFSLSYTKGRRYCTVWYFTGDVPGAGGLAGGRILIAYY